MSDWTSLNEIMRDLSVAQGHIVPASLEALGDSAPPNGNIEEETENAFYRSCGDVDYTKPPDFGFIQQMLTVVKNKKEAFNGDILQNSNLNPLSLEFIPTNKQETGTVKKKRKERNVAIESILQNLEMKSPVRHRDVLNNPMNMFRSKCSPSMVKSNVPVSSSPSDTSINNCQYTPSAEANVYYNKYMAKAKLKEQTKQDIWSRVEQELKTNDEIQQRRVEESPCSSTQSSSEEVSANSYFGYGLYKVSLQHHRHLLLDNIEDCLVCNVTTKHGYCIDEEL